MSRTNRLEAFHDAFDVLCGRKLGEGLSRKVYECDILPGYVVKVEEDSSYRQNVMEMEIWMSVVGTPASRWFAECKCISPNGKILIMEQSRRPSTSELLAEIPIWFTDVKVANWGMVKSRDGSTELLVCHDYGYSNILYRGTRTKRMKKADW